MWFLIVNNQVVGSFAEQKEIYGGALNFIRARTNESPYLVMNFESIMSPLGCYYTKKEGIYHVRQYFLEEGFIYNAHRWEGFEIHISEFTTKQRSALKPRYLDMLKKGLVLS